MAITYKFYVGMNKRANSTARPSNNLFAISLDCVYKDNTDTYNPILQISSQMTDNMSVYTYASCTEGKSTRYYYVTSWRWIRGIWECSLKVDVLATYKSNIGAYSGLLKRSANKVNSHICDEMVVTLSDVQSQIINASNYTGSYTYIIGVYGNLGATYYAFSTYDSFNSFTTAIFGNAVSFFPTVDDNIFDVTKYISTINIVPYEIIGLTPVTSISIGPWTVPATATRLGSTQKYSKDVSIDIPRHPQMSLEYTDYLNSSPFTNIIFSLPGFGIFSFSPKPYSANDSYTLNVQADPRTCSAILTISNGSNVFEKINGTLGGTMSAMQSKQENTLLSLLPRNATNVIDWAVDNYKLVGETVDNTLFGTLNNITSTGATPAKDVVSTAIKVGASYLYNDLNITVTGANQSLALLQNIHIVALFQKVQFPNYNELGYPYYDVSTPASGYNIYSAPSISLYAPRQEIDLVNTYLSTGFYYE